MTKRQQLVHDYLHNQGWFDAIRLNKTTKKAFARMLQKNHPNYFDSLENARHAIRRSTGAMGSGSKKVAERIHIGDARVAAKQFELPKSLAKPIPPLVIPKSIGRILILNDIHFPFHEPEPLKIALEFGKSRGVEGIYLNGDIVDCYQISRFDKDRRGPQLFEEREMLFEFFEILNKMFPNIPKYFKVGNHDVRWEHYLMTKAPELVGLEELQFSSMMRLKEYGLIEVKSEQMAKFGRLAILHGHEFGNTFIAPVNPARGLYMRAGADACCGHYHQTSSHHEGDINSNSVSCFSIGALCNLKPTYRPFAYKKWNHGFALADRTTKDNFKFNNKRIENGEVVE
jgi:predicted phosphodiesterase